MSDQEGDETYDEDAIGEEGTAEEGDEEQLGEEEEVDLLKIIC